jgi:hypothetical protein
MAEQSCHIKSICAITKHEKRYANQGCGIRKCSSQSMLAIRSKEKLDNLPARQGMKDAIIQKKRYMLVLRVEFQGLINMIIN